LAGDVAAAHEGEVPPAKVRAFLDFVVAIARELA